MVRKSVHLNGLTRLALTKLDVLGELSDISMCTHYEIQGKKTDSFPADPYLLEKAKPVYETLPGWKCDLSGCKKLSDFPANARRYIDRLQQLCFSIPLLLVSVGPDRVQTIEVETI
jgi:adenylosuccinate synthase